MPRPSLKQRKDGRYACRYKNKFFYGSTQAEAYAARDRYKREEASAVADETVAAYAAKWLPVHKAHVTVRTYNNYAEHIRNLIQEIGSLTLNEVTPSDIKGVYASFYIGKAETTIHKAKFLFTALFDSAVEDGAARRNPCRLAKAAPHKGTAGTHRVLTDEEDQRILSVPSRFRLAVLVMRYAGLRRGEVLAMDIDRDVDFSAKTIRVRESVRFESNQPKIVSTKTTAGDRTVPLVSVLADALKGQHGLVAPSATGGIMSESAFKSAWAAWLYAIEKQMNGGRVRRWHGRTRADKAAGDTTPWKRCTIRPHDLRHSYCTMLRDAGVEMKLAMRWMGHADEKMILRIYDHVTERRTAQAVENIEKMIVSSHHGSQSG